MTSPRSQLVDPEAPGFYHCISRCVRRAFLCGEDALTGRSFEHRKQWVEDRLLELAEVFAVGVYAYAVMSNHLHLVVYVDPSATLAWSPDEVAQRWVRLTPVRVDGEIDEAACEARAAALAGNAERIAVLRERLGSLSWFMRFLNEPIARRANREDGCTGHFWEARFKCQALLDDAAVLACMAYVDLNPIRAGLAPDLPSSPYTSSSAGWLIRSRSNPRRRWSPLRARSRASCPRRWSSTWTSPTGPVEWPARTSAGPLRGPNHPYCTSSVSRRTNGMPRPPASSSATGARSVRSTR
ncbi:MAG: hypothetical protein LW860_12905 [Xanthomonadaceae bacterium]|nr:hypothetical protein [Xanthomonadaceae bacterium]